MAEEKGEKCWRKNCELLGIKQLQGEGLQGVGCGIYEGMNIKQFDSTYVNGNGNERKRITYIYEKGYVK